MHTINEPGRPAAGASTPAAALPGTWQSGDNAVIANTLQIVGETLAESMRLTPGSRVLDVAAGSGNASLALARRWHRVISTDRIPAILAIGAERARAEGLGIDFQLADAEGLGFADGSFDAVVSTFGVMFAHDQRRAAIELVRVCRDGSTIGHTNWTPESFIADLLPLIARYRPGVPIQNRCAWGDRAWLYAAFGSVTTSIECTQRAYTFRYRDADHFMRVLRSCFGPIRSVFDRIDGIAKRAAEQEIRDLLRHRNAADDGSIEIVSDYLESILVKEIG